MTRPFRPTVALILLLTYVVVLGAGDIQCGDPKVLPVTSRIVNGHEAKAGSWPWVVMLMELNVPTCSGTILSKHVILTAAHCFDDPLSRDVRRWQVMAGKHHTNKYDRGQRTYYVDKLIRHENYDSTTVRNDIALLFLHTPIEYSDTIMPACLPGSDQILLVGKPCFLAGWGDTLDTGDETVLNQVELPVLSDATCSRPDWYGSEFDSATMVCAGYETGKYDACTGDSGSPLSCKHDGHWYVQGIASWGYGCAEPKWPGLYTEVYRFVNWIEKMSTTQDPIG